MRYVCISLAFRRRLDRFELGIGVGDELVDRHGHGNAEGLDVPDMPDQVGAARAHGIDVFAAEPILSSLSIHQMATK